MGRYLQVMGVLIVLQIIVSVTVLWPKSDKDGTNAPFIALDVVQLNTIQLSDMQNNAISLKKSANAWVAQQNGIAAPANNEQVNLLLSALTKMPAGLPVSTSRESLARFAVADNDYQWKLEIAGENSRQTIFFGTTAGSSKRHARHAENSMVYALNYSLADKAIIVRDWIKRDLLALPDQEFIAVDATDYVLHRVNDEWKFPDQAAGETIDQDLVAMFVGRLGSLRIDALVTGETLEKLKNEKPVQTVKLTSISKNTSDLKKSEWAYDFYKLDDKNYIKRNDIDGFYEISLLAASDLFKVRSQWLAIEPGNTAEPVKKAKENPAVKTNQTPLLPEEITGFDK